MNKEDFKQKLIDLDACLVARRWADEKSLKETWESCERGDWMLWLYKMLIPENKRQLT